MASKKDLAITILLLAVIVAIVVNRYYPNQMNTNPTSTFQTTPQPEPTTTSTPLTIITPAPETHVPGDSQTTPQSPTSQNSNPPATELKLGVYENDPAKNHPQALTTIDWGANGPLERGQSRNSSKVYFRNEGNEPIRLNLSTSNWTFQNITGNALPEDYKQYFTITWNNDDSAMAVNETRPITLTLTLSPDCKDVADFSFSLIVIVTQ